MSILFYFLYETSTLNIFKVLHFKIQNILTSWGGVGQEGSDFKVIQAGA